MPVQYRVIEAINYGEIDEVAFNYWGYNDGVDGKIIRVLYKPLWVTMANKELKKKDLFEIADISSATVAKMGKNEYVALEIIDKICTALDCEITDVVVQRRCYRMT